MKVKIQQLESEIQKTLNDYRNIQTDKLKEIIKEVANDVKADIQKNVPKKTGAYAKSWRIKEIIHTGTRIIFMVHSKNKYQLTHLLEYGHAKRNGGRTKVIPHISIAEAKAIQQMDRLIEMIQKIDLPFAYHHFQE